VTQSPLLHSSKRSTIKLYISVYGCFIQPSKWKLIHPSTTVVHLHFLSLVFVILNLLHLLLTFGISLQIFITCWDFDWDHIECLDQVVKNRHLDNIESFYQCTWNISPFIWINLIRFIPQYLALWVVKC
jgi:hypothetical protein